LHTNKIFELIVRDAYFEEGKRITADALESSRKSISS